MSIEWIVIWLIIGAIAGFAAGKIMKRTISIFGGNPLANNIIVGIIGSFIGNFIVRLLGLSAFIINWWITAIVVAIAGACLLIYIVPLILKK